MSPSSKAATCRRTPKWRSPPLELEGFLGAGCYNYIAPNGAGGFRRNHQVRVEGMVRPSRRDLTGFWMANPPLKRWAIIGRPAGTGEEGRRQGREAQSRNVMNSDIPDA